MLRKSRVVLFNGYFSQRSSFGDCGSAAPPPLLADKIESGRLVTRDWKNAIAMDIKLDVGQKTYLLRASFHFLASALLHLLLVLG